uniref:Rho GTPase-activating protein 19 n=1 Tax=Schistocephalus solidus TaxID=70667 RepID=A0A0X3NXU7_SCHSO
MCTCCIGAFSLMACATIISFCLSGLTMGNLDGNGNRVPLSPLDYKVAIAKQLKALRILRLLLPEKNQQLLRRFLDLLRRTVQLSHLNKMSAENLGTVFGPPLLAPIGTPAAELHRQYANLARLATLMIEQGSTGIFSVPTTLAEDVIRNLPQDSTESLASFTRSLSADSGVDSCGSSTDISQPLSATGPALGGIGKRAKPSPTSSLVIYTGVIYAHPSGGRNGDANGTPSSSLSDTEFAVAELCATVQALPDTDPRKLCLIQRINNSNGGLTPALQVEYKRLRDALSSPSLTPLSKAVGKASWPRETVRDMTRRKASERPAGILAKRPCSKYLTVLGLADHEVAAAAAPKDGEATTSSTSLDGRCAPFCCPIISVLASPFRRPVHSDIARVRPVKSSLGNVEPVALNEQEPVFEEPSYEDDFDDCQNGQEEDAAATFAHSPIFSGLGINSPVSSDSEFFEQVEFLCSPVLRAPLASFPQNVRRSSTCLSHLRVRRNYARHVKDYYKPRVPAIVRQTEQQRGCERSSL